MGKYLGPKLKIIRRLGSLPAFTNKIIKNRIFSPGQHGTISIQEIYNDFPSVKIDFLLSLLEKQKLRFNYGIRYNQLIRYLKLSKYFDGFTIAIFFNFLESRFDCIIYRIGFTKTIFTSKQYINHCHIFVNGKKITIPSFFCKKYDIISLKKNSRIQKKIQYTFNCVSILRRFLKKKLEKENLIKTRPLIIFPKYLNVNEQDLIAEIIDDLFFFDGLFLQIDFDFL